MTDPVSPKFENARIMRSPEQPEENRAHPSKGPDRYWKPADMVKAMRTDNPADTRNDWHDSALVARL